MIPTERMRAQEIRDKPNAIELVSGTPCPLQLPDNGPL